MVLGPDVDRRREPGRRRVVPVTSEVMAGLWAPTWRRDIPGIGDDAVDDLVRREAFADAHLRLVDLAVLGDDGVPGRRHPAAHRRRHRGGRGGDDRARRPAARAWRRRVVARRRPPGPRRPGATSCWLLALADDWPRHWYARLGLRRRRRPLGCPRADGHAAVNAALLGAMRRIVGRDNAVDDPEVTAGYAVDWTGRWRGRTPLVVRPGRHRRGGGGRRRGAPPTASPSCPRAATPAWSAAASRSPARSSSRCGDSTASPASIPMPASSPRAPGPRSPTCTAAAADAGWAYGVDLAARDSATVGGTVATNAGGLRVLRYGDTRAAGRSASRRCSATARWSSTSAGS